MGKGGEKKLGEIAPWLLGIYAPDNNNDDNNNSCASDKFFETYLAA